MSSKPSLLTRLTAVQLRIRRLGGPGVVLRHMIGLARREGWRGLWLRVRRNLTLSLVGNMPPRPVGGRVWQLAEQRSGTFDGRVAIMLHAYYPDLLGEIREALARMPQAYTLLVSVIGEDAAAQVRQAFAGLPQLETLEVKVLPNRGRDIAPLLAGFATALAEADLICHIHTKKSLYTSTEQRGWRQHLYASLFPPAPRLGQLLGLFNDEARLGMVYPAPWAAFPYWGYTWLSNRQVGRDLLERLGCAELFDASAYFDYPAGSMFWARRAALQPLLDLKLRYADFPEEHGQNDGCLQHAIERSLVLASRLAGFQTAVIDLTSGRVREGDDKNLQHYLHAPLGQRLSEMTGLAEVLTLDIFDTLLQRPFANPDRVFDYLTEKLAATGSLDDFTGRRKGAEVRARQRLGRDVGLADIYVELARSGVPAELCDQLQALEIATEQRLAAPRPALCAALAAVPAALPRLLVSDMYLPATAIEEMLATVGIRDYQALWVSCETGRRKDSGGMWRHLRDEASLTRGRRLLHVGDNEHSDVQLPLALGAAQVCHVMRATNLFDLSLEGSQLADRLTRRRWQDDLLHGLLARRASRVIDVRPTAFAKRDYFATPENFGYALFGPLLWVYLHWIFERARADGVTDLLYVAREGHLFNRLHQKIIAASADSLASLPRGQYFLCSRQASGLPSLHHLDDLRALAQSRFHGTLGEFIDARLDPDLLNLPPLAAMAERRLVLPNDSDELIALFAPVAPALLAMAEQARQYYGQYLAGLVGDADAALARVALVDLGYSATTQRNLQRMLGCALTGYYMLTHKNADLAVVEGGTTSACFAAGQDYANAHPLFRHSLILEAMLTAPHGQVRKILPDLGFDYAPVTLDQSMLDALAAVHRGIEEFFDDLLGSFGADWPLIRFDAQQVGAIFEAFVGGELAADDVFRQMHVEDDFGGIGRVNIAGFYGIAGERLR